VQELGIAARQGAPVAAETVSATGEAADATQRQRALTERLRETGRALANAAETLGAVVARFGANESGAADDARVVLPERAGLAPNPRGHVHRRSGGE
jgi:hypothetical protein